MKSLKEFFLVGLLGLTLIATAQENVSGIVYEAVGDPTIPAMAGLIIGSDIPIILVDLYTDVSTRIRHRVHISNT